MGDTIMSLQRPLTPRTGLQQLTLDKYQLLPTTPYGYIRIKHTTALRVPLSTKIGQCHLFYSLD